MLALARTNALSASACRSAATMAAVRPRAGILTAVAAGGAGGAAGAAAAIMSSARGLVRTSAFTAELVLSSRRMAS